MLVQLSAQQEQLIAIVQQRVREVGGLVQGKDSIAAALASERTANGQAGLELEEMRVRLNEQTNHAHTRFLEMEDRMTHLMEKVSVKLISDSKPKPTKRALGRGHAPGLVAGEGSRPNPRIVTPRTLAPEPTPRATVASTHSDVPPTLQGAPGTSSTGTPSSGGGGPGPHGSGGSGGGGGGGGGPGSEQDGEQQNAPAPRIARGRARIQEGGGGPPDDDPPSSDSDDDEGDD